MTIVVIFIFICFFTGRTNIFIVQCIERAAYTGWWTLTWRDLEHPPNSPASSKKFCKLPDEIMRFGLPSQQRRKHFILGGFPIVLNILFIILQTFFYLSLQ